MRGTLASFACAALIACAGSAPDLDLKLNVSPHMLAQGETATIVMRIANVSWRPLDVTSCNQPYVIINSSGDTVTAPIDPLPCHPPPHDPPALEPNDTLSLSYSWAGDELVFDGQLIVRQRVPDGVYTIHGTANGFSWPSDTIRILP